MDDVTLQRIKASVDLQLATGEGEGTRWAEACHTLLAALQTQRLELAAMQRRAEAAEADWQSVREQLEVCTEALDLVHGRARPAPKLPQSVYLTFEDGVYVGLFYDQASAKRLNDRRREIRDVSPITVRYAQAAHEHEWIEKHGKLVCPCGAVPP